MNPAPQVIRVLIADDHPVVRGGLVTLLDQMEEMEVVGEARDGVEAVELVRRTQPDVILLDLMMPRKTGYEAMPEIKAVSPHSRILVLTSTVDDDKIFAAMKAGALGYLLKEITTEELRGAIRRVHQGLAWLSSTIARRVMRELNRPPLLSLAQEPLTERELEVLVLVARGLAVGEIAQQLLMHEQTVYLHITHVLIKLGQGQGPQDPLEPPLPLPIPSR